MKELKRIGLYGIGGTGKTTVLKKVSKQTSNVIWLEGAKLVLDAANTTLALFKRLSNKQKYYFREKAIDRAFAIQEKEDKPVIIDGHLIFAKGENEFENVMTEKDAMFYTDYLYLKLPVEIVLERHKKDKERKRHYSATTIRNWIDFELKELTYFCHSRNVNFHIIESINSNDSAKFICDYAEP